MRTSPALAIENCGQTLKVRSHCFGIPRELIICHPVTLEQREHDFAAAVIGQHSEGIVHNRALRKSHIVVKYSFSGFPGETNLD